MYSAIFELILTLIGLAQNPNLTVAARQQALLSATQTLQVVSTQISSMNTKKASPESTPESRVPNLPPQASTAPTPVQNEQTPVSTPEPVLQGNSEPVSPYTVEGNSVPKSGGVFTFTVKKDNKPIEEIEKVSGNVTNQVFLRLPEDLPPGRGQFHIYIPEQLEEVANPSLDLVVEGNEIRIPISG